MPPGGPPPDDEADPTAEWGEKRDTAVEHPVELDPTVLVELDADELTPTRAADKLPGYRLGWRDAEREFFAKWDYLLAGQEHRGAAKVLHAVREHLLADGARPSWADAIVKKLAERAGVKLG